MNRNRRNRFEIEIKTVSRSFQIIPGKINRERRKKVRIGKESEKFLEINRTEEEHLNN